MTEKLRIVFMGTPEFAVGILDAIIKSKYDVVGVITAADKPAGRGQKIKYSAVKEYSIQNNLRLLQPVNLKDESFIAELKSLNANLQIVVAFRMLPKIVWELPALGTFNLHASLLPDYRGAAPINWAIIKGETKTGVTTFFIDDKIDTGAIILKLETEIRPTETAGQVHDRLIGLGSQAVLKTLVMIADKSVTTRLQNDNANLKTAHKLNKENCKIDWNKTADEIYNLIRGLSPYPAAWCHFNYDNQQLIVKIYAAEIIIEQHLYAAGKISGTKKELLIAVQGGFIKIVTLQLSGRNKMGAKQFLNGTTFSENAYVS